MVQETKNQISFLTDKNDFTLI